MMNKAVFGIGAGLIASGLVYIGAKLHGIEKVVGMSAKELSESTVKDISDNMMETAVKNAANDKMDRYMNRIQNRTVELVKYDIQAETRKAVENAKGQIEQKVHEELTRQAANIDPKALQKKVEEEAQKRIIEKFDGNLDDILKDFKDNLDRVKKIYTSVAETLDVSRLKNDGKEITFKVN